jgi:hypothetical protein
MWVQSQNALRAKPGELEQRRRAMRCARRISAICEGTQNRAEGEERIVKIIEILRAADRSQSPIAELSEVAHRAAESPPHLLMIGGSNPSSSRAGRRLAAARVAEEAVDGYRADIR